jgi:hypothetical protein
MTEYDYVFVHLRAPVATAARTTPKDVVDNFDQHLGWAALWVTHSSWRSRSIGSEATRGLTAKPKWCPPTTNSASNARGKRMSLNIGDQCSGSARMMNDHGNRGVVSQHNVATIDTTL